jgi:hypothetical protein
VTFITPPRERRRRRRGRALGRWALRLAVGLALFAIGLAVGRALEDNPDPGPTVTKERPLTFTVESR